MQALSQLSYGPVPSARPWVTQVGDAAQPRPQIRVDLKCLLLAFFVVGNIADDVGDVLVAFFLVGDEG